MTSKPLTLYLRAQPKGEAKNVYISFTTDGWDSCTHYKGYLYRQSTLT